MVSCFKCMKPLPFKCTCKVSEKTKVMRYFDAGIREFQLCLAVMNGYKPKVKIRDEIYEAVQVKREDAIFELIFPELINVDWRRYRTFILLDLDGKPLYRYSLRKLGISMRAGRKLTLTFKIGAEVVKYYTWE